MEEYICQYCGRKCKNLNSLRQHEIRCKENPNHIKIVSNWAAYNKIRKPTNQFIKAKELGLDPPIVSKETREKFSKIWKGKQHTEEEKKKLSESMKNAVIKYPDSYSSSNVNGRVKHYKYNGFILDGKWELEVAKYLDSKNIKWEKPKNGFEYEWNNSIHIYFPDFYLPEYNYYIEVKGYQRDRDLYKWKVVDKLIIIKEKEIKDIRNNIYDIFREVSSQSYTLTLTT